MAGIGLMLKNLLSEDRYGGDFKANLYSLVISSGPWVFAVLTISALNIFSIPFLSRNDMSLFRAIVVYSYAYTLIVSSIFQLILTRFISDRLYQREYSSLMPNFIGAMTLAGLLNFVVASVFIYYSAITVPCKVICVMLFCTLSFQWIMMVFLSGLRDYLAITLYFFIGFLISFVLAMILGFYFKLDGYLGGFLVGQILINIFLLNRIIKEFPFGKDRIFEFVSYFKKYPQLSLAAFLYNFGFWSDKIMAWYSPRGTVIEELFRYDYPYDTAMFLAILTTIPAMAFFFLQVETQFYESLRRYVYVVLNRGCYEEIEKRRKDLTGVLNEKLSHIFKFQFLFTFIIFLLAPNIISFLGYSSFEIRDIFMIALWASFFQICFLILIVLLWYLEFFNESALCVFIFAFLNTGINYYLIYHTKTIMGFGYLISIFISFLFTLYILIKRLKKFNYVFFLRRPVEENIVIMPGYK